jgi:hypothetical protein
LRDKPRLDDVTLCCVDTAQPIAAARAVRVSTEQCAFAAAILFTDREVDVPGVEVRRIAPLDASTYSRFMLRELVSHVTTPFALVVQWDGYVLSGTDWDNDFLEFDYIGAPWFWHPPGQQVGNGGFSLRSHRLLTMLANDDFPVGHPEDDLICRKWRPELEGRGIKFADPGTAARFAFERDLIPGPRFGFHGMFNFWRTVSQSELANVLDLVSPSALGSREASELIVEYLARGRHQEALVVLERFERVRGVKESAAALINVAADRGEHTWDCLVNNLGDRYPELKE